MPFKRIQILVTSGKGRVDVLLGTSRTIGIGLDGQQGAPLDAFGAVPRKLLHARQLLDKGAFTRQVLGPDFGTAQMNAIVYRIHLGPTHVNGMNEFVCQCFVRHDFVFQVLLT